MPSTINLYRCRPAGIWIVAAQSPLGCLCIGMAVSGFQPLKSPAIEIVCAPGALAGFRVNSTL